MYVPSQETGKVFSIHLWSMTLDLCAQRKEEHNEQYGRGSRDKSPCLW